MSIKYYIIIFYFRVRFKVFDFCGVYVSRSPIFVKDPVSDLIFSWMNPWREKWKMSSDVQFSAICNLLMKHSILQNTVSIKPTVKFKPTIA